MDVLWEELTFGLPGSKEMAQVLIRIAASALLGACIGIQREKVGKPAGIRTHILVSLGTTVFILGCARAGMQSDALSRVIQGIVTGIGFIGAGSILKLDAERDIKGLTTAAGVWMTAAIGVTVGMGELGIAITATIITLVVLMLAGSIEKYLRKGKRKNGGESEN
jgi:putative Mg2+ transporter-C (MgtC) family protein